jgi:hypothetical protein
MIKVFMVILNIAAAIYGVWLLYLSLSGWSASKPDLFLLFAGGALVIIAAIRLK